MDNVIQNIKIDDIIPNNNHQYNQKEIGELAASIKQLGLLEPITVRPIEDNKYELILGNKRYRAAIIAGLKTIPAIIKQIDNIKLKEYLSLNNNSIENQFLSNKIEDNSDVINLSKLNEEYERDELKMNNTQIDNNNNMQVPNNNQPAFGGRFFPSLEDEPTNMNFSAPNIDLQPNNNFIDLTDVNAETQQPIVQAPTMPTTPNINNSQITENIPQMPVLTPSVENQPMTQPSMDNNIINLESLKQNNELITQQPIIDNNNQGIVNDFQTNLTTPSFPSQMEQPVSAPIIEPQVIPTQQPIEQVQNIMPTMEAQYNNPINPEPIVASVQPNMESSTLDPIGPQLIIENPMTNPVIQQTPSIPEEPTVVAPIQPEIQEQPTKKDVLPVINTIKSIAVNLENFGYTIRITDEDLTNSYKITIEVEK